MKNVVALDDKIDYGNLYFKDLFVYYEFYLDKYFFYDFFMKEAKEEYDVDDEMASTIAYALIDYYKLDGEITYSTTQYGTSGNNYSTYTEGDRTIYLACVPKEPLYDAIVFDIAEDDMNVASRIQRNGGVPAFLLRAKEGTVKNYWEKEALDIILRHEIEIDYDFSKNSKIEFKNLDENTYKIYKKIKEEQKAENEKVENIQDNMFENLMNDTALENAGSRNSRLVRRAKK